MVPSEFEIDQWHELFDFYEDPKSLARAKKSSENRGHQVVDSRQGSQSFVNLRLQYRKTVVCYRRGSIFMQLLIILEGDSTWLGQLMMSRLIMLKWLEEEMGLLLEMTGPRTTKKSKTLWGMFLNLDGATRKVLEKAYAVNTFPEINQNH